MQNFAALGTRGYYALLALVGGGLLARLVYLLYDFFYLQPGYEVKSELYLCIFALSIFPLALHMLAGLAEVRINSRRNIEKLHFN